ncbi:MAG: response regulator [Labilithrix sp.]|nr:response regulator [Labilithrix sp.]MBX3219393.1 response regulator [Labilithrix sp.]
MQTSEARIPPKKMDCAWVLLVDDHDDGRELLGEFLSFNGYEVEGCSSGEDALELVARRGRPGVVITDLSLGLMSGSDLARRLRRETTTASVPILAVTGHVTFEDPERLFTAVLVKPVALPDLAAALRRAIGR